MTADWWHLLRKGTALLGAFHSDPGSQLLCGTTGFHGNLTIKRSICRVIDGGSGQGACGLWIEKRTETHCEIHPEIDGELFSG